MKKVAWIEYYIDVTELVSVDAVVKEDTTVKCLGEYCDDFRVIPYPTDNKQVKIELGQGHITLPKLDFDHAIQSYNELFIESTLQHKLKRLEKDNTKLKEELNKVYAKTKTQLRKRLDVND